MEGLSDVSVVIAEEKDASLLAEVEIASFEADTSSVIWPLLYPPTQQGPLRKRIETRSHAIREGMRVKGHVFVKVMVEKEVAGFAEWVPPGADEAIPSGTDVSVGSAEGAAFVTRFKQRVDATRKALLGESRYWYLAMLAVGPSFQKRGVGRALVRWGTDLARADPGGPLPAFLEASVTGEQFYRKIGFLTLGWDELPDPDAPQGVCKWPYMCTCAPAVTE